MKTTFNSKSLERLMRAHPILRRLAIEVRKTISFEIDTTTRGKAAQTRALRNGFSKVKFGDSAHNYEPSLALDFIPVPLDWKNKASFEKVGKAFLKTATIMNIPVRWLGDGNRDGIIGNDSFYDAPHVELYPWRDFKSKSKLVRGL